MTGFIASAALDPVEHRDIIVLRSELGGILTHITNRDEYIALCAPRQSGKTTLLYQIRAHLDGQGYGVAYVDLEGWGDLDKIEFYQTISTEIQDGLSETIERVPGNWCNPQSVTNQESFLNYLTWLSANTPKARKLIIMFDEVGGVPEEIAFTFFKSLRSFFHKGRRPSRHRDLYQKILLIFSGALDLYCLIQEGTKNSPLNICQLFQLSDFSAGQVQILGRNLIGFSSAQRDVIASEVYKWTNGHPYFTQKLYMLIDESTECHTIEISQFSKVVEELVLKQVVYGLDSNLAHILYCLRNRESFMNSIPKLLENEGQKFGGDDYGLLQVIGVAKQSEDMLFVIRNRIYKESLSNFFAKKGAAYCDTSNSPLHPDVRHPYESGTYMGGVTYNISNSQIANIGGGADIGDVYLTQQANESLDLSGRRTKIQSNRRDTMIFEQGHALIIGIGSYAHLPAHNIPISVTDAEAVKAVLCDPQFCGYLPESVTFLHDAQTTRQGIIGTLNTFAGSLKTEDTFVLYYCGHGDYGEDGDYYLTTHDTQAVGQRVKKATGIRAAELIALLRQIPVKRLLLIFNACHSGELSPSLGMTEPVKAFGAESLPEGEAAAVLGSGEGRILITASRPEQRSWIGSGKLSLFAQAVVDGLSGKGILVSNNAGYISVFSLYEHIYTTVKEAAAKLTPTRQQEPELTVLKNVGPFPVALYRGASSLGTFDGQADALPEETAVRTVDPKISQRVAQKFVIQAENSEIGIIGDHAHVEGGIHFGGKKK